METVSITNRDYNQLLSFIYDRFGFDFFNYAEDSLKRRIDRLLKTGKIKSITEIIDNLQKDPDFFNDFLVEITVNITEFFRDADFFNQIAEEIIPQLSTYPHIRIWHAGSSSGEEVYSMAILLKEYGILNRTILYATDINLEVLKKAKSGKFFYRDVYNSENKYAQAGGLYELRDYFDIVGEHAIVKKEIRDRIVFSSHNLVNDQSFNEFNLIICRNVLIYFNKQLQEQVIDLFKQSLIPLGFLALGSKENLNFKNHVDDFNVISKSNRIWRLK